MSEKRGAASMEAAAMSFVLDREGHKKFLRVATNQELEMRNKQLEAQNEALKALLAEKTEEADHFFTECHWFKQCCETHVLWTQGSQGESR